MTLDRNDLVDGVAWGLFAPVVVPFMLVYYIIKCTFILGEKFKNRNKK
jgi:Na+/alanine symporter